MMANSTWNRTTQVSGTRVMTGSVEVCLVTTFVGRLKVKRLTVKRKEDALRTST